MVISCLRKAPTIGIRAIVMYAQKISRSFNNSLNIAMPGYSVSYVMNYINHGWYNPNGNYL